VVGSGEEIRIKGNMFHLKEIEKTIYKVAIWPVINNNVELFAPNHNDDPPHLTLKDVEGINTLWDRNILS
jgi:hypothetical protein